MGNSRKRMWGVAAGAIALGIVGASVAVAGLVAGGGGAKSDCYAQLNIKGVDPGQVKNEKHVTCVDGTACDGDRTCNGTCVVQVEQCWNKANPSLPGCTPPAALETLQASDALAAGVPQGLDGSSCSGAFVGVEVPTKKGGTKPGKVNLKVTAKAPKGVRPRTDRDAYKIICVPNDDPSTCGASPSGAFLN